MKNYLTIVAKGLATSGILMFALFAFAGNVQAINVDNLAELQTALSSTTTEITLTSDITTDKMIEVLRPVTIDGGLHTISLTGNSTGWQSRTYALQVYNTEGVTIKNIKLTGGEAGLLVNASEVTLSGAIDVTDNEFGGIEVSRGGGELPNSILNAEGATFTNTSEEYKVPTIWLVNGQGTVNVSDSTFTTNTAIKSDQTQYYLNPKNASDIKLVAENFNTNKDARYYGIATGFNLSGVNLANITGAKVELLDGSGNVLVTNTFKETSLDSLKTGGKFSSSFRVKTGTYTTSSSQDLGSWAPSIDVVPAKMLVTVTDTNGAVYKAENTSLQATLPSHPTWESLFQPNSIAITKEATKTSYTVGESLDISGLEVTGFYDDNIESVENITTANVSGFDSSAPVEDQVLTITVGDKTATTTVDIKAAPRGNGGNSGSHRRNGNSATPATPAVPGVSSAIPATPSANSIGEVLGAEDVSPEIQAKINAIRSQLVTLIGQLIVMLQAEITAQS